MNGRCDNNPLDASEEVCGICAGEFCAGCVISTRNRRQRVCKNCALEHSGLRTGDKSSVASRRRVKGRQRDLETIEDKSSYSGFTYFDDPTSGFEFEFEGEGVDDAGFVERRKRIVSEKGERTSNRRRFGRFGGRRKSDPTLAQTTAAESPQAPSADTEPTDESDVDTEVDVLPSEPLSVVEAAGLDTNSGAEEHTSGPTATELLQQLRETPSEHTATEHTATEHDAPSTASAPSPPNAPSATNVARAPENSAHIEQRPDDVALPPAPIAPSRPEVAPESVTPAAAAEPPLTQERLDLSSSPFGPAPAPTPAAAAPAPAPAQAQPRRQAPQPAQAAPPTLTPNHATATTPAATPPATDITSNPFGSPVAAPAATSPSGSGSADTDAEGNWIPPILRGMAPVAEREAAPLPQRRSSD